MGGIGIVIAAYSGVVATEHMVSTPQVLTYQGMKNRLSRPGIPHIPHQGRGQVSFLPEEPGLPQQVMGQDDGLINVIAGLLLADDRADQDGVGLRGQPGPLHQPLVAGVGHVAALVSHHPAPTPVGQGLAQLPGRLPESVEGRINGRRVNQGNRPGHELVLIVVGAKNPGMGLIGGAVNLLGQKLLVIGVNLGYVQRGQGLLLIGK